MFLNARSSPSEDDSFEELRSSISVVSGAGTGLNLSSLVQPQSEQQRKVLNTISESTCSTSTAAVSSSNVENVLEVVSRKELNTSCDSEESGFRTSDLVELVVDDYANEFDDDFCLPYESSTCVEESPASESQVTSAVAEANTESNDGVLESETQVPSSGDVCNTMSGVVWLSAACKIQRSNIGGGAGRRARAGLVDNEDISLKKGRSASRSVRQTRSSAVVSLLDVKPQCFPESLRSGLSALQCNANKNFRFSKSFDSGASEKRSFHIIKVSLIDFISILLVMCIYISYFMKYNIKVILSIFHYNKTSFVDCTFGTLFSSMHFVWVLFFIRDGHFTCFQSYVIAKFL